MRFVFALLFVAVANAAQLLRVSEPIPGRYIVKIKPGIRVKSVLPSVRLAGARVRSVYDATLNGFSAELSDRKILDAILNLPAVEYVEEDGVARAMGSQIIGDDGLWGLDRIDQRERTLDKTYIYSGTGSGVTVYVFDTGIKATHSDFGGRVTSSVDCTTGTCMQGDDNDFNGHGTHCAGTVGGSTYGVAKEVNLVGVKVLGNYGTGSWSGVIAGVDYVAQNAMKPSVASMSLGGSATQALDEAVEAMISKGIPTVVAAGNSNINACNVSPARLSAAVTVGATNVNDTRWTHSNWGPCLDIFAPGQEIKSAWFTSNFATHTTNGTSMACPHVAGALAIALEGRNDATPADLGAELIKNATVNTVDRPGIGSPNLLLYIDHQSSQ